MAKIFQCCFWVITSLLSIEAFGQMSSEDITKKYNAFKKEYPGVKVQLIFNQSRFAPGDTVWFKAYFLYADNSPVKGRQLLDLNVVASDGSVLHHFLFSVTDGVGFNQFALPEATAPGFYRVSSYSSWMLNFDPPPLFSTDIEVVGEKELIVSKQPARRNELTMELRPNIQESKATIVIRVAEGSMLRYQGMHLVATREDKIVFVKPFCLGIKSNESIPFDVSPGAINLSVIDKAGRVVETMPYFFRTTVDPFKVRIEANDNSFIARKKTSLTVTVLDKNNQPVQGEFSLSVLSIDDDEGSFLDTTPSLPQPEPWRQIFSGRAEKPRYRFTTDLFRTGTAYYSDGVTPLPAGTTIVFYLQNNDVILQATTIQDGKFTLPLRDIDQTDIMIAVAERGGEPIESLKIKWGQNSVQLSLPPESHEGDKEDPIGVFVSTKRLIDKAFLFYGSEESAKLIQPRPESFLEERIDGADNIVDVQKYVTFQTMEEVIREIIPALQARKVRGELTVRVVLREPMPVANGSPVFIIDGVVTTDVKYFFSLKPADLLTVKAVTKAPRLLPLGLIGKNGIVIVETVKGTAQPSFEQWQLIEGVNTPLQFKKRNYDQVDAHRPDLRSTIFWAPTVSTDPNGKAVVEFVHSDDTGSVMVVVNGLTTDGRHFKGGREFRATLK